MNSGSRTGHGDGFSGSLGAPAATHRQRPWSLKRSGLPIAALPIDLVCVLFTLGHRHAPVIRLQRLLCRTSDHAVATVAPEGPPRASTLLVRLPLDLLAFFVAGYIWLLLPMNWFFPLRAGTGTDGGVAVGTWGGPTLQGAWAVHAVGGTLVFGLVGLPLLSGITWILDRQRGCGVRTERNRCGYRVLP
jgi:hypothetical protein